jgi:hypothetical protein
MDFKISNHPIHTAVTRTASLTSMSVDTAQNQVVLKLKINHFLKENHIPEMVKDIISVADNSLQIVVGPVPEVTEENPNPVAPTVGEFDYWMLAYEGGMPLKQMLAGGIANIDSNGLINNKCNYSV